MKPLISHSFSIAGISAALNIAKQNIIKCNTNSDTAHKITVYLNFEMFQMRKPLLPYTGTLKLVLLDIQNSWDVVLSGGTFRRIKKCKITCFFGLLEHVAEGTKQLHNMLLLAS